MEVYFSFLISRILILLILAHAYILGTNSFMKNWLGDAKEDIINVHVIPHSHDDAGWLATMDQYFYGNNRDGKCVKCILDNMVISLNENNKRTFTYVEMVFFEKWYNKQDQNTKLAVQKFVKEGRLDFSNGGWVVNDEASTYYQDIVDQMRMGMLFLNKEFNFTPKVAWYLDSFGHSLTNAYLLAKLGFENMVISRIDFREKEKRIKEKTLEFIWRPYYEIDKGKSSILTHITHGHYCPDGNKFPDILEQNRDSISFYENKLDQIYAYFKEMSDSYPTRELMFLYGDDFTFRNANQNFRNIEALIEGFKKSSKYKNKLNIFYSTPTNYFDSLKKYEEAISHLTILDGLDFFPYSEYKLDYWTGYFTSRPYLKGLVRDAGSFLSQSNKYILTHLISGKVHANMKILLDQVYLLRRELSIAQHHDGVSGTAREAVSLDYINRLDSGIKEVSAGIKALIENDLTNLSGNFQSICIEAASQSEWNSKVYESENLATGILFIYVNPGIEGTYPVKIKVKIENGGIIITDLTNSKEIVNDLICDSDLNYCVINTLINFSKQELYKILKVQINKNFNSISPSDILMKDAAITIADNKFYTLTFDPSGMSFHQKVKSNLEEYNFSINHGFYDYHFYLDPALKNRQGAYLMATDSERPKKFSILREKSKYYAGKLVSEIDILYEKSKVKIRIYPNNIESNFIIECESILMPNNPKEGIEFLLIVESNVNNMNPNSNKTEFYTDTNGMRIIKRIKDTRLNFEFEVDDKVASNFYPVNSLISINSFYSDNHIINVFNDRPQAGTSLEKGEIFLNMNRWSPKDDRKGLADGLDESNSSNSPFYIHHWITTTKNEFNKLFLHNLIHQKPVHAVYENVNSDLLKTNIINNESIKLFFSNIDKQGGKAEKLYIIDNSCIEVNFYFISENTLLIQFMNKNDPYLHYGNLNKCTIKFVDNPLIKSIEKISLNGIEKINAKVNNGILSRLDNFIMRRKENISVEYSIGPLDFETFKITI